jgi:hypothetical protein
MSIVIGPPQADRPREPSLKSPACSRDTPSSPGLYQVLISSMLSEMSRMKRRTRSGLLINLRPMETASAAPASRALRPGLVVVGVHDAIPISDNAAAAAVKSGCGLLSFTPWRSPLGDRRTLCARRQPCRRRPWSPPAEAECDFRPNHHTHRRESSCCRGGIGQWALSHEPISRGAKVRSLSSGSDSCRRSPRLERFASEEAERVAGCEMTLDVESVVEGDTSSRVR